MQKIRYSAHTTATLTKKTNPDARGHTNQTSSVQTGKEGEVEMEKGIGTIEINGDPPKPTTFEDLGYVRVVRCKDCKWYSEKGFCKHPNGGAGNVRPADWFCGDGERGDPE